MASPILVGVLAGATLSVTTSYAITALAFHRFQRATPETWRRDSWRQHVGAILLYALAGASVALIFVAAGAPPVGSTLMLLLAAMASLCAICLLIQAVYVRWHLLFVVGLVLEWLVFVAGVLLACAWFGRQG